MDRDEGPGNGADPKEIVRRGYDAVSLIYAADDGEDGVRGDWLSTMAADLQPGSRVLDLGCGCGIPTDRWLVARGHRVVGVDISEVQIDRARRLVPDATFLTADMCGTDLAFDEGSFDAVVSFFAIIHVPLSEQRSLFERIARWLRPGGLLLVTVGHRAWTGTEEDWLGGGARMYWSHGDVEMYLRWLVEIGFSVETSMFIPEGEGGHVLVRARRP